MKKSVVFVFVAILIGVFYACKKDNSKNVSQRETYNPTPATIQYPDFVKRSIGEIKVPTDNPLTVEGIALGRRLFYEKMLSNDMSISCNSCHKQQYSFDDPRRFSIGTDGTLGTRNAMPIVNMGWNDRFFWDGRRSSLETQAHDPVVNPIEMENTWPVVIQRLQNDTNYPNLFFKAFGTRTVDSNLVTKAIAQFERTFVSFNSIFDQANQSTTYTLTTEEFNGEVIFFEQGRCINCHGGLLFTDHSFRNNGLDAMPNDSGLAKFTHNPTDFGKFKVPSLRNVALTAPYMHDGRFNTLEEVVDFYTSAVNYNSPNIDSNMQHLGFRFRLSAQEKTDLVAFLKTLTDSSYVTNSSLYPM